MSRIRFVAAVVITALLLLLAGSIPASNPMLLQTMATVSPTPAKSADARYSIFSGTMVDMTWAQVETAAKEGATVLLPTAVIEEHGPHMGLGIDTYESYLACQITRRELEARGIKALIAPPLYWGINVSTGRFPGSFSTRTETFKALLYDVLNSLHRWGLSRVFVLNTHGDPTHNRTLVEGIDEARRGLGITAYVLLTRGEALRYGVTGHEGVLIQRDPAYKGPLPTHPEVHAGAFEVGMMAYYFPGLANIELAKTLPPTSSFEPLGYWGDPAGYNSEASHAYFEAYYQATAEAIAEQVR